MALSRQNSRSRQNSTRKSTAVKRIGTKAQVYNGRARQTSGGLRKHDLIRNPFGRIVSKRKSENALKNFDRIRGRLMAPFGTEQRRLQDLERKGRMPRSVRKGSLRLSLRKGSRRLSSRKGPKSPRRLSLRKGPRKSPRKSSRKESLRNGSLPGW
jgi:hypothetical protein